jgi:hypothetical protein
MTERRIDKRYRALDGALAALCADTGRVGQIHNISSGGLAFRYIADSPDATPRSAARLQLMIAGEGVWLEGIPVRWIADIDISPEASFSGIRLRQTCLQFVSLTDRQKDSLRAYIRRCTARTH